MMLQKISPVLLFWFLAACTAGGGAGERAYLTIEGPTMGTAYRVTYADSVSRNLQPAIEELLAQINGEVSTYIDSSTISRFNQSDWGIDLGYAVETAEQPSRNAHFLSNFQAAQDVFNASGGAFDPTVMPLVNYWGFGYTEKRAVTGGDSLAVDSLTQLVGFDLLRLENDTLFKTKPGVQLDFSAIAKGYAVDALGELLEGNGINHYLVDIGGEIRARGVNPKGLPWRIGINIPEENVALNAIQTAVPVRDQSIATSGNYRNFYEVDGVKYSHTISPFTGFPERNTLLSASVFSRECMVADAYATAFMVLGVEAAWELANRLPGIEAYFIYSLEDGLMSVRYTDGLGALFDEKEN